MPKQVLSGLLRSRSKERAKGIRLIRWLLALGALLLAGLALAQEVSIPPPPTSWVTDSVGLLSPGARQALDDKLASYQRQTGHQVAVWIGSTLGVTPIEDFTVKTFEAWALGQKGKDDGVLVVVMAEDRRIAIEVGYGLEGVVPDAVASRIINEVMVPQLRASNADGALASGIDALLESIEGKPFASKERTPPPTGGEPSMGQILLYLVLGVAFLLLFITNPTLALSLLFVMAGRGGGGHGGGFAGGGGRSGGGGARGSW